MSRFFKPNNSTFLYLNTSFNCIKSNSITITKTGNGTGYTSTPTVVNTPASGDMGSVPSLLHHITPQIVLLLIHCLPLHISLPIRPF
jgi:hypothetical protein